jgi:hypothetical protein
MICSGKQVEIESFELTTKGGLISKCLYVNQLLTEAGLNESHLDSDPMFTQSGKVILLFVSSKDTEEFAARHGAKFNVSFNEPQQQSKQQPQQQQKKNVSFNEHNNYSSGSGQQQQQHNSSDEDDFKKPILKRNSNSGLPTENTYAVNNSKTNTDLVLSANTNKAKKVEGYEILVSRNLNSILLS